MNDIGSEYRKWGLRKFLYARLMRALAPWLFFCSVEVRTLCAEPKLPKLAPGRSVRVATQQELEAVAADPIYEMSKSFIRESLERGSYCMAVFQDDKIISYAWRSFSTTPHVGGIWVEIGPNYRYGYKGFTHPDFRQQGLQHFTSLASDADAIRRGCTLGIGFIETHNYPSLISNAKRNNKRVGFAGYLRFRGRVFPFRTPGAKKHGFRFFFPPAPC